MDPENKKKCIEVVEHFFKLDSCGGWRFCIAWLQARHVDGRWYSLELGSVDVEPFRERVNWEEWGLYDYLQVVKEPMDLGTIRSKLSKNEYKKPVEFARDMRLVWENCKLYNQDGSDLYLLADELTKKFEDRVKTMKLDVGPVPKADRSIPYGAELLGFWSRIGFTLIVGWCFASRAPSLEEKIHFSQNIYKVADKDLGAVVKLLEEQCPKALDRSSPDELDIVVDHIDNKTFRDLEKFVLEKVPEGSREPIATPKSKKSRRPPSKKTKTDVWSIRDCVLSVLGARQAPTGPVLVVLDAATESRALVESHPGTQWALAPRLPTVR